MVVVVVVITAVAVLTVAVSVATAVFDRAAIAERWTDRRSSRKVGSDRKRVVLHACRARAMRAMQPAKSISRGKRVKLERELERRMRRHAALLSRQQQQQQQQQPLPPSQRPQQREDNEEYDALLGSGTLLDDSPLAHTSVAPPPPPRAPPATARARALHRRKEQTWERRALAESLRRSLISAAADDDDCTTSARSDGGSGNDGPNDATDNPQLLLSAFMLAFAGRPATAAVPRQFDQLARAETTKDAAVTESNNLALGSGATVPPRAATAVARRLVAIDLGLKHSAFALFRADGTLGECAVLDRDVDQADDDHHRPGGAARNRQSHQPGRYRHAPTPAQLGSIIAALARSQRCASGGEAAGGGAAAKDGSADDAGALLEVTCVLEGDRLLQAAWADALTAALVGDCAEEAATTAVPSRLAYHDILIKVICVDACTWRAAMLLPRESSSAKVRWVLQSNIAESSSNPPECVLIDEDTKDSRRRSLLSS